MSTVVVQFAGYFVGYLIDVSILILLLRVLSESTCRGPCCDRRRWSVVSC